MLVAPAAAWSDPVARSAEAAAEPTAVRLPMTQLPPFEQYSSGVGLMVWATGPAIGPVPVDDPGLSRDLGAAARTRVERDFTAERMAASSLEIYQSVAERAG